jgi:uncharacterized protein
VTFAVLNLCHAEGHEEPRALVPGEDLVLSLPLTAIGYAFPPGHRIRLALSSCYWPWAWPSPGDLRLAIRLDGESRLELPVREPQARDGELRALLPPPPPEPPIVTELAPVHVQRTSRRDPESGRIESETRMSYFGSFRLADGLVYAERGRDEFSAVENEPLTAEARSAWEIEISRGEWRTRIVVASSMRGDDTDFVLEDRLEAYAGDELVVAREWRSQILRDYA